MVRTVSRMFLHLVLLLILLAIAFWFMTFHPKAEQAQREELCARSRLDTILIRSRNMESDLDWAEWSLAQRTEDLQQKEEDFEKCHAIGVSQQRLKEIPQEGRCKRVHIRS